ncbi:polar amino acid ABC transporter, inner membrane subunit [Pseudomonas sp. GM41(2012)]|jgi:general L-amino acid transport system permease protein|uniref:amino acid ABC transporter permease n=1 Tax=Pseudomonas sp. (strain GM41(2012)) TaxID=1144708 RepID=UPI0002701A42|nr:amino acid ABC transporter permease [Pseudomonas sp. GM41(2012)]EUB75356.1 polar amino acid ABC transporter, inner membrane subunit [Pseudomonas sp. GM41(2012)]
MSGDLNNGAQVSIAAPLTLIKRLKGLGSGLPSRIVFGALFLWGVVLVGPSIFKWLVLDATFIGDAALCHQNGGACWAFIGTKLNLILFGAYPPESLWRPITFVALIAAVALWCLFRVRHHTTAIVLWVLAALIGYLLMSGGLFGLESVDRARWGGLPITLLISIAGLVCAFPLGVLLALGCRSEMPLISVPCRLYVDLIRSVPAITIVFMTFAIIPLILPDELIFDKLFRAGIGLSLFTAAYFSEALRGALQALSVGQRQASASLGFGYWGSHAYVILPQVIAHSLQPIANIAIAFVKNSSLLMIIGLFDLLGSARSSLYDENWQGFYKELYLFVGVIYFVICMYIQHYVASIERERRTRLFQ